MFPQATNIQRAEVESGRSSVNPTGCSEGWLRLTDWFELVLLEASISGGVPGRATRISVRAPRKQDLRLEKPVSATGGQNPGEPDEGFRIGATP